MRSSQEKAKNLAFLPFTVWVSGQPKGQPRPRAFSRGGKARVYDPGTAEGFKASIALAIRPYIPAVPLDMPVAVTLDCVFQRPKDHSTKKGLKPTAPRWHTGKPDIDNVLKAVCDALTEIGFWRDDAVVVAVLMRKEYGVHPGVKLTIETLP